MPTQATVVASGPVRREVQFPRQGKDSIISSQSLSSRYKACLNTYLKSGFRIHNCEFFLHLTKPVKAGSIFAAELLVAT